MSDRKYTIDELEILNIKVCCCFYSWCQHEFILAKSTSFKSAPEFIDKFLMDYYLEKFFHEIFELYKFFKNTKDPNVFHDLVVAEDEYSKLLKVRNKSAHVDVDMQDRLKSIKEFIKSTKRDNQILDLIV